MNCKLHIVGPLLILVLASAGCGAGDSSSSVSEDMQQDKVRVKVNDARVQGSYQTEQSSSYEYLKTGLLQGIQGRFPDANAEEIAMAVIDAIDAESNGQLALINKKNHALWAGILAGSAVFPPAKGALLFLVPQLAISRVQSYFDQDMAGSIRDIVHLAVDHEGWLDKDSAIEIWLRLGGVDIDRNVLSHGVWKAVEKLIPQSERNADGEVTKNPGVAVKVSVENVSLVLKIQPSNQPDAGHSVDKPPTNLFPEASMSVVIQEPVKTAPGPLRYDFLLRYPEYAVEYTARVDGGKELWQPITGSHISVTLPQEKASCGSHRVTFTLRDANGHQSLNYPSMIKTILVDCGFTETKFIMEKNLLTVKADDGIFMLGTDHEFLCGGEGILARYRIAEKQWQRLASPPLGLRLSAGAFTGTHLVVAGGTCDSGGFAGANDDVNKFIQVYDVDSDQWHLVRTPFPSLPRDLHAAVSVGQEVAFFGGRNGEIGFTFNPVTSSFRDIPPSPIETNDYNVARYRLAWTGDEVIVIPAMTSFGWCCRSFEEDVYAWNPLHNNWRYVGKNHIEMDKGYRAGFYNWDIPGFVRDGIVHIIANNRNILGIRNAQRLNPITGEWLSSIQLPRADYTNPPFYVFEDHVLYPDTHGITKVMLLDPFLEDE